ncbi:hypothetical protein B0H66DRAFT_41333 [Apodospora peruviana]|uniref:Fucose-specific lectin n=1 Tax=Apodospora peruviana TaxID=516989 RepID=A0AAE0IST3_9PEZI|nr:hypothetical protein B0H66DRAFT_41333 [Apodospora peruviana]
MVVIGAVLGGIFGSKHKATSGNGYDPSSSVNSTGLASTKIRMGSPLAVTGWRQGTFFNIWLFYQGPDDVIRLSTYSNDGSNWSRPHDMPDIKAIAGSPLAATTEISIDPPRVHLFYLDKDSTIQGRYISLSFSNPLETVPEDLNPPGKLYPPYRVNAQTARLAAYWPFLASQNQDGSVQWFERHYEGQVWTNYTLPDLVLPSVLNNGGTSSMVLLPTAAHYFSSAGLLYVDGAGGLSTYLGTTNNTPVDEWSWKPGKTGVSILSPIGTSIAAYVNAGTGGIVKTHALLRNGSGIYSATQDDKSGTWDGPLASPLDTDLRLGDGTALACPNMAIWGGRQDLSTATDMNRCYYQTDSGKIKELYFDSIPGPWGNLGFVPLD